MKVKTGDALLGYRLERYLGHGAQAEIWSATNTTLGRTIAVKVLAEGYQGHEQAIRRLKQEARLLARLKHAHILSAENFYEDPPAILMDYMAGGTLRDKLPPDGLQEEIARAILMAVLDGAQIIHEAGVVHRDLKPANILFANDVALCSPDDVAQAWVKIADFGLALDPFTPEDLKPKTGAGQVLGTLEYMPPEQHGLDPEAWPVDLRADLYALGIVLYELLTGTRPYVGDRFKLQRLHKGAPLPPHPRLSPRVFAVLERACAKDRRGRFESAAAFKRALKDLEGPDSVAMSFIGYAPRAPALEPRVASVDPALRQENQRLKVALREAEVALGRKDAEVREAERDELRHRKRVERAEAARVEAEAAKASALREQEARARRQVELEAGLKAAQGALGEAEAALKQDREARARRQAKLEESLQAARTALSEALRRVEALKQEKAALEEKLEATKATLAREVRAHQDARASLEGALRQEEETLAKIKLAEAEIARFKRSTALPKLSLPTLSDSVDMAKIPAGVFWMGSPKDEGHNNERPHHQVQLSAFSMMITPVTQEQYQRVMGRNPSTFFNQPDSAQRPVENVSWLDAVAFCNALSKREGGMQPAYEESDGRWRWLKGADGYRLPTEAEWEYAARAGTTTRYGSGDSEVELSCVGWYSKNSGDSTHQVAKKEANAWGLFDMHGNVWEWCFDWYRGDFYKASPKKDPDGPSSGSHRVYRGGSWRNGADITRAAFRALWVPGRRRRRGVLGFRIARGARQ